MEMSKLAYEFHSKMESGILDINVIFPPSGLDHLVVPCFFAMGNWATERLLRQLGYSNTLSAGWTVVARGNKIFHLNPGIIGNPLNNTNFFVGAEILHFLTALSNHLEQTAIKVNLKIDENLSKLYYYPDVKIMAENDYFWPNWSPHNQKNLRWKVLECDARKPTHKACKVKGLFG